MTQSDKPLPAVDRPKVLALVSQRYNGAEFWITLRVLRDADILVDVCSTHHVIQDEVTKKANKIKMTVADLPKVHSTDYSGLIVISGNPSDTEKYYVNRDAQRLVREFNAEGKPLAGICAAVPTLAPAVRGKKVSWFPLQKSRLILEPAGAILQSIGITVDGNIVTAENEHMTRVWAEAFRDLLLGVEPNLPELVPSGHGPKLIPRREKPFLVKALGILQRQAEAEEAKGDVGNNSGHD